jgi:predicted permease
MISTIIGALLPIIVTLLLGFVAGWHHDFDARQASVLNRMVTLYALPLSLFAGMVGMSRDQVLSQGPMAFAILVGMAGIAVTARNIVIPALIWGLMLLLGMEKEITREGGVTLAIPTASLAVILAVQYQVAELQGIVPDEPEVPAGVSKSPSMSIPSR